uniref:Protein FRA10AC1 homolog n=1 Tax=Parastrongyloides trichosuri TaxID=131310 RepID=A0A0N4ZHA8_PARTI
MGRSKEKRKEKKKTERILKDMDIFKRHQKLISTFVDMKQKEELKASGVKYSNPSEIVKSHMKFIYDSDVNEIHMTWEERLAKRYYDRIYKEYCIADLSKYEENKIALRWRMESEVRNGKGQFVCGGKGCEERENLSTWEVNFKYKEEGEEKNALVKLCLCEDCSKKLNFHSVKRKISKVYKDIKKKIKKEKLNKCNSKKRRQKESVDEEIDTNYSISPSYQETLPGNKCVENSGNSSKSIDTNNSSEKNFAQELDTFLDNFLLH